MGFDVDVEGRRGERVIRCTFATGDGVTVLVGPSGAGKTSVLHMIAGLVRPERGHVRVGGVTLFDAAAGVDVPVERRRAGYVFQDARLFPHRRVRANLMYGAGRRAVGAALPGERRGPDGAPHWAPASAGEGQSGAALTLNEVAALLDIVPLLDRWPRTLSGGEARRVAIGRALLSDPAFLLLDEPLASLDPARRKEGMRLVERLAATGLPVLMVTHDERDTERLGTAVVRMG